MSHYMVVDTAYGSKRVYVEKQLDLDLIRMMNDLSIWRGFDKSGKNYISWEIDPLDETTVRRIVEGFGKTDSKFTCYETD